MQRSDSVRLWAWGVYCAAGAAIVFVFVLADLGSAATGCTEYRP